MFFNEVNSNTFVKELKHHCQDIYKVRYIALQTALI